LSCPNHTLFFFLAMAWHSGFILNEALYLKTSNEKFDLFQRKLLWNTVGKIKDNKWIIFGKVSNLKTRQKFAYCCFKWKNTARFHYSLRLLLNNPISFDNMEDLVLINSVCQMYYTISQNWEYYSFIYSGLESSRGSCMNFSKDAWPCPFKLLNCHRHMSTRTASTGHRPSPRNKLQ